MNFQFNFQQISSPISHAACASPCNVTPTDSLSNISGLKLKRQPVFIFSEPAAKQNPEKRIFMEDGTFSQFDAQKSINIEKKESICPIKSLLKKVTIPQPFNLSTSNISKKVQPQEKILQNTEKSIPVSKNISKHHRAVSAFNGNNLGSLANTQATKLENQPSKNLFEFKALPLNKRILERPDKLPEISKKLPTVPYGFSLSEGNKKQYIIDNDFTENFTNKLKFDGPIKPFNLQTEIRAKEKIVKSQDFKPETQQFKARALPSFYGNKGLNPTMSNSAEKENIFTESKNQGKWPMGINQKENSKKTANSKFNMGKLIKKKN